ncbi:hypothetical protein [Nocardioides campestrisoli]|nr:hypothetical protein [Nocardioides campestrisoli]
MSQGRPPRPTRTRTRVKRLRGVVTADDVINWKHHRLRASEC